MSRHETVSDYDNTAACFADVFMDEEEASNTDLINFTDDQLRTVDDIVQRAIREGILIGVTIGCDHPELAHSAEPEEFDFYAALQVANIDGFHRGYLCRDLQSTNREER